jgi:phosphohistidine phosphatase
MKLYLAQHGEACAKDIDPQRPLTDQGREDIERLAAFLAQASIQVERVIDSGKLRAAQTADLLAAAVAPLVELETSDRINPNDDPRAFNWEQATGGQDTLVVGHLPFMARLVSLLVVEDPDRSIMAYRPGSIVCLERDSDGHWQIIWMIRPHLLRQA